MTIRQSPLLKTTLCIGLTGLIAGCNASGGDADATRAVVDMVVDDITADAGAAALEADVRAGNALIPAQVITWDSAVSPIATTLFDDKPVSPWANTPTSGQRNYIGGVELVPNGNDANRVFGVMTATADFTTNAIAGTGRDFVHIGNGTAQGGTLTLDAEFFPDNDLSEELGISGSLTGTLSGPDLAGAVDIDIAGDFADSGGVIYGGGNGTANDGGSVTNLKAAVVLSQN